MKIRAVIHVVDEVKWRRLEGAAGTEHAYT